MSNGSVPSSPGASSDGAMDTDTPDTATNGNRSDNDATPRPEPVNENDPVRIMPFLGRLDQRPERHDVCIVGAGPAGLMLGLTLARLGIKPLILDERADQTPAGRADGMQPKTIETLRMLGLADELLQQGVKVYDICLWHSSSTAADGSGSTLRRVGRETHYPAFIVDLVDPFILVGHQGMVEKVFVDDLARRGVSVRRCHRLDRVDVLGACGPASDAAPIGIHTRFNVTRDLRSFEADFLVGCDGAHSRVRRIINQPDAPDAPDADADADAHDADASRLSAWGVLDGEVDTDFPDIWTKSVVFAERFGSILIIPRERDMTRLYIEMRPDFADAASSSRASPALVQAAIMRRAAQILQPYHIRWRTIEWFGQYRVSQRVAARFCAPLPPTATTSQQTPPRVFIAGDAAHTHSPKAAQGMNTALHDSWNLAWKLNLAVRGLSRPDVLLASYEAERQKIARDLAAFDLEHANEMSRGDPVALADNFRRSVRFISGVGVEYGDNALNRDTAVLDDAEARPGRTLPPGKVSRYIDANPVDVQLDVPVLGQFKIYVFAPDVLEPRQAAFLAALSAAVAERDSLISRLSVAASKSYLERPRVPSPGDLFKRPERYTALSQLFVFALITSTPKHNFEISELPPILARSPWTIYLDDVPDLDTQGRTCTDKYLGGLDAAAAEVAILNVRPDGYVGSVRKWSLAGADAAAPDRLGHAAAAWLDDYFGAFLSVPG